MQSDIIINVYHFINYNRNDLTEYLLKIEYYSSVICFDLEDSVQDIFIPQNTPVLKKKARNSIRKILLAENLSQLNWGIRVNSFTTQEINHDIELLKDLNRSVRIRSLLLPKTESKEEIESLLRYLQNSKIEIEEIIPVIETRKGFENINLITGINNSKFKRIVFGHCDFNYDNNIFPFFHQNSGEYWEWIKQIFTAVKSSGKEFINSAYLRLNDDEGFNSMLYKLSVICGGNFGQVALNYKQSALCRNFKADKRELNGFEKNLKGKDILIYAENIVKDFENNNEHKGFSIAGKIKNLISPHEYKAAKNYLLMKNGN